MRAAALPCLVLAGGVPRPGEPLYSETMGRPKALLEIAGRPMVQWVLDALADSGMAGEVVLAGLEEVAALRYEGGLLALPPQGSLADNLFAGIARLLQLEPAPARALYCWSDIPLATGPMLRRFTEAAVACADESGADVVAGLVGRRALEERFSELDEPWLRLREGLFVAADFGLFDPRRAEAVRRPLEVLTGQRKSAIRQAGTVGLGLLVRYLLGRLSLPVLERTLERRYGVRPRILVAEDPELGLDVDGPANLAICRSLLER